jgi:hypothetical protein
MQRIWFGVLAGPPCICAPVVCCGQVERIPSELWKYWFNLCLKWYFPKKGHCLHLKRCALGFALSVLCPDAILL